MFFIDYEAHKRHTFILDNEIYSDMVSRVKGLTRVIWAAFFGLGDFLESL